MGRLFGEILGEIFRWGAQSVEHEKKSGSDVISELGHFHQKIKKPFTLVLNVELKGALI